MKLQTDQKSIISYNVCRGSSLGKTVVLSQIRDRIAFRFWLSSLNSIPTCEQWGSPVVGKGLAPCGLSYAISEDLERDWKRCRGSLLELADISIAELAQMYGNAERRI